MSITINFVVLGFVLLGVAMLGILWLVADMHFRILRLEQAEQRQLDAGDHE